VPERKKENPDPVMQHGDNPNNSPQIER